ncbi:SRPBCC family protein [Cytophagaceae bacterium ABcell3]|nr:SRPBCC family protein [Cytophagaceae bacterium ABcell3]
MKKRYNSIQRLFTVFIASMLLSFCPAGESDHERPGGAVLVKSSNGIAMYERWIHIPGGQEAREVLLQFSVNATSEDVFQLIRDVEKTPSWNRSIKTCRELDVFPREWSVYIRYGIPWPFNDQDCILKHQLVSKTSKGFLIEYSSSKHPEMPKYKGVERMEQVLGKWEVSEKGSKTFITYTVATKPSGVPQWVTDPFVRDAFISSMKKMVRLLEN